MLPEQPDPPNLAVWRARRPEVLLRLRPNYQLSVRKPRPRFLSPTRKDEATHGDDRRSVNANLHARLSVLELWKLQASLPRRSR